MNVRRRILHWHVTRVVFGVRKGGGLYYESAQNGTTPPQLLNDQQGVGQFIERNVLSQMRVLFASQVRLPPEM